MDERCFIAAFAMVNNQMVINGAEMMLIYGDLSCLEDKDWSLGRILESGSVIAVCECVCVCVHAVQFADFVWQSVERRGTE